jgi:mycothiol synthase
MPVTIRSGSPDDFDNVLAISQQAGRALAVDKELTAEELRADWTRPTFRPERHLLVALDDDGPIGHASLEPGSTLVVRVRPERVGRGVEAALIAEAEERARADGLSFLLAIVPAEDVAACRAYEEAGYASRREVRRMETVHESEPDAPRWPDGISIRTYRDEDARPVQALLDAAYLGWDEEYVPVAHEDWLTWMTSNDSFDPACWFLAEARGELAAVALNWKEGWVKDLAVRPEWRRRGLGEALLRHTFRVLWHRGVRRVGLKVDSDNGTGAPRLYERVGMQVDRRYPIYSKAL